MSNTTLHTTETSGAHRPPHRGIELPAAVAISWSLAGGLLLGGVGVAALIFAQRMSGHLMLAGATVLFITGALIGLAHGVMLGILGRPTGTTVDGAFAALAHGLLYLLPALLVGWLLAGWIAALPIALKGDHVIATVISALAWLALLAVLPWAARRGWTAAVLAYRRWPDRVLGTSLIGLVGVALLTLFLIDPPTIWLTRIQLSRTGGLFFAGLLTFWFYGPMITVALRLARRMRPGLAALPERVAWPRALATIGIALGIGLLMAVIAVPFYRGSVGLGLGVERYGMGVALLGAAADALTDELFFRLIALTIAFVAATRLLKLTTGRALALAIVVATGLDLLVHWPTMPALGLPGAAMLGAYLLVRVGIPAALFGYLYWRRGLGAAMTAHLTSSTALLLLAA